MKTFAVIYGLAEGEWHGRRLIAAMRSAGYELTTPDMADIVIAHSGGWLFVPPLGDNQRLIIINPSHRSSVSFGERFRRRAAYDSHHFLWSHDTLRYLHERLWNIVYLFRHPHHWLEMRRRFFALDIDPLIAQPHVAIVQTDDLAWYDEPTMSRAARLIWLPGDHDALWRNPEPFVDAIRANRTDPRP